MDIFTVKLLIGPENVYNYFCGGFLHIPTEISNGIINLITRTVTFNSNEERRPNRLKHL